MNLENRLKNHLLQYVPNCARVSIFKLDPKLALIFLRRRNLKNLLEFKREYRKNVPRIKIQEPILISRLLNNCNAKKKLNKNNFIIKKMIN